MKILCFSDSHGHSSAMEEAIALHDDARHIVFLGDGENDIEYIKAIFPDREYHIVAGNCDRHTDAPMSDTFTLDGIKIFFTHSHYMHGVGELVRQAKICDASIALCGHTHIAFCDYTDGVYIMNPGSVAVSRDKGNSYGLIELLPTGILTSIVRI